MIQNEVFDNLYARLSGRDSRRACEVYERKRENRARLALACQNYFFGVEFSNAAGTIPFSGVQQTEAVERSVILRGGGINARSIGPTVAGPVDPNVPLVDLKLYRSGSSRAQINRNALRSSHYVSDGQGQPWELDWPVPWTLQPNEVIQVALTQITQLAVPAAVAFAINFYGVAVDPKYRCEPGIIEEICAQICDTEQRPFYLNVKSNDSSGTITYDAQSANLQFEQILTDELDDYALVLGFRRNDASYIPANSQFRLSGSDGRQFSRDDLFIKGFEYFNAPDNGYFRFAVPHLIRKGQSITATIASAEVSTDREQFEGEINLLCVTV